MRKIRELGFAVKLDTNGNHPQLLKAILDEGLVDYVAMDIKNTPEKYAVTCGLEKIDMEPIKESIDLLKNSGIDFEFRTTVVDEFHKAEDFYGIGELIRGADRYFLQCFTDRDSVPFGDLHAPSKEAMETYADIAKQFVPSTEIRGMD